MKHNTGNIFIYTAAALLIFTATAKMISSMGAAGVLKMNDPILEVPFRYVFIIVALVEFVVAFICLFSKHTGLAASLIAWLATSFLVYRLGLWWLGYNKPCKCMGNLTDILHISEQTADSAMKCVLAYMLFGSYIVMYVVWRRNRNIASIPGLPARITHTK